MQRSMFKFHLPHELRREGHRTVVVGGGFGFVGDEVRDRSFAEVRLDGVSFSRAKKADVTTVGYRRGVSRAPFALDKDYDKETRQRGEATSFEQDLTREGLARGE